MSLRLYFIRHGQTEWVLSHRHTGRSDIPLTEQGEKEARALIPLLSATTFNRVFTSPSKRARQTCVLSQVTPPAEIEPDLSEWDYGDYEGLCTADIRKSRPKWDIFRDGCPGGEMPDGISGRADRLIAHLKKMDGNIGLFSHGQFGSILAARWIGLAVKEGPHFVLGTASLSILGHDPDHPDIAGILLWNASSHQLAELAN